jgi:hypothetical protein
MARNYRAEAEDHVRRVFLRAKFGQRFSRERLRLSPGGTFDFDAVSDDEKIVCCISTSAGETSGGNRAVAKLSKMKADVLHLLLIPGEKKRVMAFTDSDMAVLLQEEKDNGRIPKDIEILVADVPPDIRDGLYKRTTDA